VKDNLQGSTKKKLMSFEEREWRVVSSSDGVSSQVILWIRGELQEGSVPRNLYRSHTYKVHVIAHTTRPQSGSFPLDLCVKNKHGTAVYSAGSLLRLHEDDAYEGVVVLRFPESSYKTNSDYIIELRIGDLRMLKSPPVYVRSRKPSDDCLTLEETGAGDEMNKLRATYYETRQKKKKRRRTRRPSPDLSWELNDEVIDGDVGEPEPVSLLGKRTRSTSTVCPVPTKRRRFCEPVAVAVPGMPLQYVYDNFVLNALSRLLFIG